MEIHLEIHDELATPGCPQCAIKHLSAALAYMLRPDRKVGPAPASCMWLAVAKINLVEVMAGYRSHLWYAVGMLVRSEEAARCEGSSCQTARDARLELEERGLDGVGSALRMIADGVVLDADALACAHLYEAVRELPDLLVYPLVPTAETLVHEIERIRAEYFMFDEVPAASPEDAEKGGESRHGDEEGCACVPEEGRGRQGDQGCLQGRQVQGRQVQEVGTCPTSV